MRLFLLRKEGFHQSLLRYRNGIHWKRKGVLCIGVCSNTVDVQCTFVRKFSIKSPTAMQIWTWHKKFKEEGYLCRAKGFGQLVTSEETVERVRQKLLRSPKNSIRRTRLETQIPPTAVWRVLRKHLLMKPYKLHFVQAIMADDKRMRKHGAM
eukprot:XP_014774765.1 PREDICTED: uncharacterized protein LOC106872333 [Octopus bimaculoides]